MANFKNSIGVISGLLFATILLLVIISNSMISREIKSIEKGSSSVETLPKEENLLPEKKHQGHEPYQMTQEPSSVVTEVPNPKVTEPMPSQSAPKKIHEIPLDDVILVQ